MMIDIPGLFPFQIYHIFLLIILIISLVLLKNYFNGGICKFKIDLSSKIIIITGANKGLGKQVAHELAKMNGTIIMACRNIEKATTAKEEILNLSPSSKIDIIQLDLSDLSSVSNFANTFKKKYNRLDILINNAGMICQTRKVTKDGLEMIMGTNYFGPFLLTNLLLDMLKATKLSRILNLSSIAHNYGYLNLEDPNFEKYFDLNRVYGGSKLAMIMFTNELGQRLEGSNVKVCCLHPGVVRTEIVTDGMVHFLKYLFVPLFFPLIFLMTKNCTQGIQTILHCALVPHENLENGKYYSDCKVKSARSIAQDKIMSKKLWEISEKMVKY